MYQALLHLAHQTLLLPDARVSARFAKGVATTPKHVHTVICRRTQQLQQNIIESDATIASTKRPSIRLPPTLPPNQGMLGKQLLQ